MKKNIFIIHGAYGSPKENWIPWLRNELEQRGHSVVVPSFPTPEGQNYENWMSVIQPQIENFNNETMLIGHSVGATFALCILEKLDMQIKKTVLVSGFVGLFEDKYADETFDRINKTIAEREFDWPLIRQSSKQFCIFHGDNDPYVPSSKPEHLSKMLEVPIQWIKNGGHLNEASGFTEFPQLLKEILET